MLTSRINIGIIAQNCQIENSGIVAFDTSLNPIYILWTYDKPGVYLSDLRKTGWQRDSDRPTMQMPMSAIGINSVVNEGAPLKPSALFFRP